MKLAALALVPLFASVARADAPKCPIAAGRVVAKGEWLAISGGARCFAQDKDGKPDPGVLGAGLGALAAALPAGCDHALQLAADKTVAYQNLIATMDLAIKAGLADVQLVEPKDLAVAIDDSDALEKNARRCAPPPAPATAPAAGKGSGSGSGSATSSLADAAIVVITTKDVEVDGKPVGDVATLAKGTGVIGTLVEALRAHAGGDKHRVVLQADRATSTTVINRVIASAKAAGYDHVLFAVTSK